MQELNNYQDENDAVAKQFGGTQDLNKTMLHNYKTPTTGCCSQSLEQHHFCERN